MSRGISQQQRDILRLALAVNIFTQGGAARVKGGAPADGYRVPTIDYEGPKDLRPPLALWVFSGARLSGYVAGFFEHDRASLTAKASITRAIRRLTERKLLVIAPLPRHRNSDDKRPDWGYCLTIEGLAQAGEPLDVPMLSEACELFGITVRTDYDWASRRWGGERKRELMALLGNGYRREGAPTKVTGYRQDGAVPKVTDTPSEVRTEASVISRQPLPTGARFDASVTDVQWRDVGNRKDGVHG
jgi:hypothetical protein